MDWTSMVAVGRIVRPHGNRGQVVVEPETDFGELRFQPGATLYTLRSGGIEALRVTAGREHDGRWIVGFEGVASIDDAEAWRGQELRIPDDAVQPLEPGAFYVHDLVGCEVETPAGRRVGVVGKVDLARGVPMLIVADERAEEVLIPFIDAICRTVDITGKRIVVDPPEGLIDLNVRSRRSGDQR